LLHYKYYKCYFN